MISQSGSTVRCVMLGKKSVKFDVVFSKSCVKAVRCLKKLEEIVLGLVLEWE